MLFDFASAGAVTGHGALSTNDNGRWGVDSEYGRLLDVMLSPPPHLELVPCNAVAIEQHRNGASCCPDRAGVQHAALVAALEGAGVRCHLVPAAERLPDLSFTRDATVMTPWGLLGLKPAAEHRTAEVAHIQAAARRWGVPILGTISGGHLEGGDVCVLRPGIVLIGYSGERTDAKGAWALASLFEARGWRAILTRFAPEFLHLDTHFTVIDEARALACVDALDPVFIREIEALGVELVPIARDEVHRLGGNVLSLGDRRIVSSADNRRVNAALERLGYQVVGVDIDQFTRCGGGIHCLTMPLSRRPG